MTSVFVSVGGHRWTQALGPQWSPGDAGKWLNPGCSQKVGPMEEGVRDEGGPHRPGREAEKDGIFGGSFASAGRRGGRATCPQETHLQVLRPSWLRNSLSWPRKPLPLYSSLFHFIWPSVDSGINSSGVPFTHTSKTSLVFLLWAYIHSNLPFILQNYFLFL